MNRLVDLALERQKTQNLPHLHSLIINYCNNSWHSNLIIIDYITKTHHTPHHNADYLVHLGIIFETEGINNLIKYYTYLESNCKSAPRTWVRYTTAQIIAHKYIDLSMPTDAARWYEESIAIAKGPGGATKWVLSGYFYMARYVASTIIAKEAIIMKCLKYHYNTRLAGITLDSLNSKLVRLLWWIAVYGSNEAQNMLKIYLSYFTYHKIIVQYPIPITPQEIAKGKQIFENFICSFTKLKCNP